MIRSKEKWQAHMNRVGGSMLRNETAELSQRFAQFGAKRRLDTVSIRYDLSTNMDMWVKDYRPTKRSIDDGHVRSYARRAAKYHWDYIVRSLAKAYGVGRTTIERIGSGMLSDFQQQASDQAASEYGDAFGAMASPNWTPGAHLEEALTEANPNVYNFTYGTQNTARFGARRGDAAWYGKGKLSGWRIYRERGGLTIVPSATGLRQTTGHIAPYARALPYARAPKAVRAVYDKLKRNAG